MKKMLKSKKGFSLIELLIVVAILAILAAISINLFGGVLNKQKDKSDQGAASYLQTAIQTYIAETDDSDLSGIGGESAGFDAIVTALADTIDYDADGDGTAETYGPYLNADKAKLSAKGAFLNVKVDSANQVVTVTVDKTIVSNAIDVTP
ncbi:MAG TPA: type II secretion system protein [Pseudobacteroides sp.]|uniref:type II secretion system protein n=1 Tax=Pseudobacteroides sp. TaxID=1968840 RepID=UPI002F94D536